MFVYQSRFLRRGEVWFDNEPNAQPVDWILYRNRSAPVHGARSRRFYNRLIDLSKSPEQLLSEMEPKTVAKIKAAGLEDKLLCEWSIVVDARQLDEIEGMWNQAIDWTITSFGMPLKSGRSEGVVGVPLPAARGTRVLGDLAPSAFAAACNAAGSPP